VLQITKDFGSMTLGTHHSAPFEWNLVPRMRAVPPCLVLRGKVDVGLSGSGARSVRRLVRRMPGAQETVTKGLATGESLVICSIPADTRSGLHH
jgi:hypothetical protein